jgi:hypothetical protein
VYVACVYDDGVLILHTNAMVQVIPSMVVWLVRPDWLERFVVRESFLHIAVDNFTISSIPQTLWMRLDVLIGSPCAAIMQRALQLLVDSFPEPNWSLLHFRLACCNLIGWCLLFAASRRCMTAMCDLSTCVPFFVI